MSGPLRGESSEQGHTAPDRSGVEDQAEGLEAHRVHQEFTLWCKTQSSELAFAVETGSKDKADLEASLVQLGATSEILQTKVSDLAGSTATTEADLNAATVIRAKEHADFEESEQELLDIIGILARAIAIPKEMKGGASMMQLQRAGSVVEALKVMVQASSINSAKNKQEDGIDGVRTVLGVLRDCYGGGDKAHEAASEESTGIIGLLEVFESDFSTTTSNSTSGKSAAGGTFAVQTLRWFVGRSSEAQRSVHVPNALPAATSMVATMKGTEEGVLPVRLKAARDCLNRPAFRGGMGPRGGVGASPSFCPVFSRVLLSFSPDSSHMLAHA